MVIKGIVLNVVRCVCIEDVLEYLLVKGIMTVTNKPGHKYSKSLRYKPRHINSKDTLTLSLSL